MSAGFGFSAGDIVAGLKLIKQSIDALQDSKGSSSEFERLVREINSLEVSLDCVQDLNLDATGGARSKQRLALQEAIENCQRCIDHFLSLISKYQPWLRAKVASRHAWKGNLMKIQWALCRKEDIKGFRAQLERHCSSINMLLIALQVQHAFKQGETQERCLEVTQDLQLQATSFEQDLSYATNQLAELNLEHQQLFQRLIASNNRLLEANERMSLELRQMRESVQLQLEIPPQVALQKPVTLLDACGSISPFHLDFINSVEAFLAVLKIRFQQQGINNAGIQMLENSQFILQDHKGVIDIFQPWQKVLRPNQRVNMSMRFRRNLPTRTCPACRHREDTLSGSLECQKCGLHYQRVEESVGDAIASTRDAKSPILSKEFRFAEWGLNAQADRDEDVIEQFRRVQLICPGVKTPSGKAKQTGKQSPKFPSSYWSSNEQRRFRSLFQTYGTDWITIANRLKTKTPIMVHNYYRRSCNGEKQSAFLPGGAGASRTNQRPGLSASAYPLHLFNMSADLLSRVEDRNLDP